MTLTSQQQKLVGRLKSLIQERRRLVQQAKQIETDLIDLHEELDGLATISDKEDIIFSVFEDSRLHLSQLRDHIGKVCKKARFLSAELERDGTIHLNLVHSIRLNLSDRLLPHEPFLISI